MDLRTFGRALRRSWWLIVLTTVIGTGLATVVTAQITPTYASKVTFFVSTPSTGGTNALQAQQVAQLQVNSYVQLLTSDGLARRLVGSEGIGDLSASDIESRIASSAPQNTVLVTATVTDTLRSRAFALTRAIADKFPALVSGLASSPQSRTTLYVVSGPRLQTAPVGPHKTLNVGLGFLAGLALGLVIAFLRMLLDTSVRTPEQVERAIGASVIGSIGFDKSVRQHTLIVGSGSRNVRAEAFRQLRTNLRFADVDNPVRVILITSSFSGEGKSTVATNLAAVFAETGQRVLLIEADLRKPRVSDYLGLERAVGLSNVLAGQVELDDVLQQWGTTSLSVLSSGSLPPNPSELLGSDNMRDLMVVLRGRFDVVIFDTPPLLPVTDAAVASRHVDGVVVVVRHGKTSVTHLEQADRALKSVDARVLGAVLNMRKASAGRRYDRYGYYEDEHIPETELPLPVPEPEPAALLPASAPVEPDRGPGTAPARPTAADTGDSPEAANVEDAAGVEDEFTDSIEPTSEPESAGDPEADNDTVDEQSVDEQSVDGGTADVDEDEPDEAETLDDVRDKPHGTDEPAEPERDGEPAGDEHPDDGETVEWGPTSEARSASGVAPSNDEKIAAPDAPADDEPGVPVGRHVAAEEPRVDPAERDVDASGRHLDRVAAQHRSARSRSAKAARVNRKRKRTRGGS